MRKPAKKKTAKPSTALARRPAPPAPRRATALVVKDPQSMLPQGVLGDDAAVGALGQIEVKLSKAEELILSEAVQVVDVRIKPSGQPYLSHPAYTNWFNRAFGRLGWAIVPQSKPIRTVNGKKVSVVVPYMLYIHSKPAAFAMGEQEYFEDSREQTFGDALEATVASALRRCAKRLGVGLELWDKRWLNTFIETHCVAVKVKRPRDDKATTQWRRKDDPRLAYEIGGKTSEEDDRPSGSSDIRDAEFRESPPPRVEPPVGETAGPKKVTIEQRKRITRIIKNTGRNEAEVSLWLFKTYGVKGGANILQKDYQRICDQLQVRGTLPMPGDGGQ